MGGPKNLLAEEAWGTKQLGGETKFKDKHSRAKIVYFGEVIEGQNTKYTLLMFFEHVEIYVLLEDQLDPKSALGGPKPISRNEHVTSQNVKGRFFRSTLLLFCRLLAAPT